MRPRARFQQIFFCLAASLLLASCVDSAAPILIDGKPLFGQQPRYQLYGWRDGVAREPFVASFRWTGSHYVGALAESESPTQFTVHEFAANDLIVQATPAKDGSRFEYAVARTLAPGVFLVIAIDEDAADPQTRTQVCGATKDRCRISTREALFALARATAAKAPETALLAIRLEERQ
jgi:hypothetical protein